MEQIEIKEAVGNFCNLRKIAFLAEVIFDG